MLIAAFVTSTLTTKVKSQANLSAIIAYRTNVLLDLSRDLERCNDIDSIILCAQEKIYKLLKEPVVIYTVEDEKISKVYNYKDEDGIELEEKFIGVDEQAVVSWVIKNKRRAGANTDTLPGAKLMYTPLVGEKKVMAVVGIVINSDNRQW